MRAVLPFKVVAVYTVLALGATMPVIFSEDLQCPRLSLLLALLNALLYTAVVVVIVWRYSADNGALRPQSRLASGATGAAVAVVAAVLTDLPGVSRKPACPCFRAGTLRLVRAEYGIAGAGYSAKDRVYFVWDPGWSRDLPAEDQ
ncbi:MAG: hypothetical protein R3D63_04475 [Paracoccaceae bacterium]